MLCSRIKHYLSATQTIVKRGCFNSSQQDRVVSEIYKKAVKVQSCTYTGGEKHVLVHFQDREKENTPKFPNIKI